MRHLPLFFTAFPLLLSSALALPDAAAHFSPRTIELGRAYRGGGYASYLVSVLLVGALYAWLFLAPDFRRVTTRIKWRWLAFALAVGTARGLAVLVAFPLSLTSGFLRQHAYGFSQQTFLQWLLDYGRVRLTNVLLYIVVAALGGVAIERLGRRWWLFAGAGAAALTFAVTVVVSLYPALADPLLSHTAPLQDPALLPQVEAMARQAGFDPTAILVADVSSRTNYVNAICYCVIGAKRIYLYDTLLQTSSPEEVLLTVAHEIGHAVHNHVLIGLLIGAAATFGLLWLLNRILAAAQRRQLISSPLDPSAAPLVLLVVLAITLVTTPVQNLLSRTFERQADLTALELTNDPATFIATEVKLAERNLLDIEPSPLVVAWFFTHPPVLERIALGERFQRRSPP